MRILGGDVQTRVLHACKWLCLSPDSDGSRVRSIESVLKYPAGELQMNFGKEGIQLTDAHLAYVSNPNSTQDLSQALCPCRASP